MNSFQRMVLRSTGADVTLSPEELKRIEKRCNEIALAQQKRFWLVMILTVSTTALAGALGGRLVGPWIADETGWHRDWCTAVCAAIFAIIVITIWLLVYERMYARPLRRALGEIGYEVCVHCGYYLRGLPPPPEVQNCPECGAPRTLLGSRI